MIETAAPSPVERGQEPEQTPQAQGATRAVSRGASPSLVLRVARALTICGVLVAMFLGYEFPFTALYEYQSQRSLLTTFKEQVATGNLDSPSAALAEGSPVVLLRIPRLQANDMVVEGSSPSDLKSGPGHLNVSPLPGEAGNSVILGRRTTYGAPFQRLRDLRRGDRIVATTGQGSFTYVVSGRGWADAHDAGPLVATKDNELTLVTSDPAIRATGRYYVKARLRGDPVAVSGRPPVVATPAALGLTGDEQGLVVAAIACQVLLGAGWLIWRQRRRWPVSVLFLLGLPVLLALAVVTFSNFDGYLPGSL